MREPPLILIVDDNPANVEILQMRLMANSYDVITATDGEMGLTMAREKLPDLILLDIMMPKMDGFEVTRKLRENPEFSHTPIIALTAHAMAEDRESVINSGCDSYLTKPIDIRQLHIRKPGMNFSGA